MLLEGENLAAERPGTWRGSLFAAALALACFVLSGLLAYRVADWPISWSRFMGYLGAGLLAAAGLAFAYWSYACRTLCYALTSEHLAIRFGLVWHLVPWSAVRDVVSVDEKPRISGLAWWGLRAGQARAGEATHLLAFATRWRRGALVEVRTEDVAYVLSPPDPPRFVAQARRLLASKRGSPVAQVRSERLGVAALPLWGDRAVGLLVALGLALGLGLLAYLCAIYPGLSQQVNYVLPPLGPHQELASKKELFKLPATALALLGVDAGASLVLHPRERAAAHLLLSGGVLMQLLFWAATLAVVWRL